MKNISKEEAEKILNSHYDNFVSAMKNSYNDWKEVAAKWPSQSSRTRACFINDQIRTYIHERYAGKIVKRRGLFFLRIGDDIAARFKKLRQSKPSNIKTNQQNLIQNQAYVLEGFEEPLIVNVGYIPDKTWNKFRYEINCWEGNRFVWKIDMTKEIEQDKVVSITETAQQKTKKKRVYRKAQ